MLFITQNLNGELWSGGLWSRSSQAPVPIFFFLSCVRKNATGKKKNLLSPSWYQGQLFCEALDLPNQTKLSVLTSNSHPMTSALH